MHVAIIDGDISYPATSGKRLRTLNLMLPLARTHSITYIARGLDPTRDNEAVAFFADHNIKAIIVNDPLQVKHGARFYGRLANNLVSPLPYSVASHMSEAMRQIVVRHADRHHVDLWQLEWSGYGYCVAGRTEPIVLQAHNVDALIWRRYRDVEKNAVKRWYIADQYRKFRNFEERAFHNASSIVAVSEADATLARSLYGSLAIDVVDNGVDAGSYATLRPDPGVQTILFLGALDWRPNLDALDFLLAKIFPIVRATIPAARLAIVGRSPPTWLRQRIASMDGVQLSADVPDVRPYLASSSVMAVPLRIGGGSRLKILEALASGLPVVSTTVGAEGLALEGGQDITLVDEPAAFAAALVECLANPNSALEQAERGRALVSQTYDWKTLAERLGSVWERTVADHEKNRNQRNTKSRPIAI